jgi:hypothetical protein
MPALTLRRVLHTWWPLAASWLLMSAELPALSAVVARLANPEIHLAAYGSIVFQLALIIESPIIMLLSASTALSKDWASFRLMYRFMMLVSAGLTGLHLLLALTPLFDLVVVGLLHAPAEVVEPARIGLLIMTPWTWTIAYRRFHQGVLIRFGRSSLVGVGTIIRLSSNATVLVIGYLVHTIPGIVVAASAIAVGVTAEAIYAGLVTQPVLRGPLKAAPAVQPPLTLAVFVSFYTPLVLTSLITLVANPIGSAALGRMPLTVASMAVWPVVTGFVFGLRSLGFAFNEVVVALMDEPGAHAALRRFTLILAGLVSLILLLVAVTPLARLWFAGLSALKPELAALAQAGLWLCLPLPALNVLQSWFQGRLVHARRTRSITASVVVYLATNVAALVGGVLWGGAAGVYVGLAALTLGMGAQTAWLWWASRGI